MLRFLNKTVLLSIIVSSIGATAYAISSSSDRSQAISQAYSDIDKNILENKKKIDDMYSDMKEYEKRMQSNSKVLSESEYQYNNNGKQGLDFNLDKKYYNPNNYIGSGYDVQNILDQSKNINNNVVDTMGINQPLVLVSFSMPDTTIKRLIKQMKEVNGSLVFRGFKDDNLKSMIAEINSLNVDKGSIIIDPTIFNRFNVNQVPTFIIPASPITACTEEKCETPKHIKVTGDVTVNYVLDLVERTGTEEDKLIVKNIRS